MSLLQIADEGVRFSTGIVGPDIATGSGNHPE
jgi:hypothetical protein